jgi:hypothetical protein
MAMPRSVTHRAFAAVVLALFPSFAIAQPALPIALSWVAPRECPDRSAVERSIAARVPSLQPRAAVEASGRIVRQGAGYQLTLRTAAGERQLSAASCDELASSAALILAFILDPQQGGAAASATGGSQRANADAPAGPGQRASAADAAPTDPQRVDAADASGAQRVTAGDATGEAQRVAAADAPSGPQRVTAGDEVAPATQPAADESLELSGYARAEWLVDIGMLAQPGTGPGIAIGLTLLDTSLELSAGFLLSNNVIVVSAGEGRRDLAQLHAFSAQLGVCQRLLHMPELAACVLGEHMRVTADPDDSLQNRSTHSAPVWTMFGAARAAIAIGTRLAWLVELSLGVPLLGARFRVDGFGVIHETGDIVGRLRTGLELRF